MRKKDIILEDQKELETPILHENDVENDVLDEQNPVSVKEAENIVTETEGEAVSELDMTPLTDWEKFDAMEQALEEERKRKEKEARRHEI